MPPGLLNQKSTLSVAQPSVQDPKLQDKEHILLCLTRLNDKSTQRAAADDLASIVRVSTSDCYTLHSSSTHVAIRLVDLALLSTRQALNSHSLSVLVHNICTSGAWEPKPYAKKVKALHCKQSISVWAMQCSQCSVLSHYSTDLHDVSPQVECNSMLHVYISASFLSTGVHQSFGMASI